jgi:hypothetical protein
MKPKVSLRIVALLTLLVAAGHTIGHFTRKITTDIAGVQVIKQMEQYKFNFNGSMRSWDNFYEGLSLDVALILFIFTIIFSMLAGIVKKHPKVCYNMLWPYLICYVGFTITGFCYFFIIPAITTLIICLLIIFTMWQLRKQPRLLNSEII